jgi:hypothetical protein
MKKTFKILGIIAIISVIGFSMTACKDSDVDPNTITITDIPGNYIGKFGTLLLFPYPITSSTPTVYAMETISGGTTIFSLYKYKRDDPWDGSGDFRVTFLIFEDVSVETNVYTGVLAAGSNITITGKNTNMAWNSFIKQ